MTVHRCFATGCTRICKVAILCSKHWHKTPAAIQRRLLAGPEPLATSAAIGAVSIKEGHGARPAEYQALLSFGYNEAALKRGLLLQL